jgi:hypothetical protein
MVDMRRDQKALVNASTIARVRAGRTTIVNRRVRGAMPRSAGGARAEDSRADMDGHGPGVGRSAQSAEAEKP